MALVYARTARRASSRIKPDPLGCVISWDTAKQRLTPLLCLSAKRWQPYWWRDRERAFLVTIVYPFQRGIRCYASRSTWREYPVIGRARVGRGSVRGYEYTGLMRKPSINMI